MTADGSTDQAGQVSVAQAGDCRKGPRFRRLRAGAGVVTGSPFALAWIGKGLSVFGDAFLDFVLLVLSVTLAGPLTAGGVGAVMALPALAGGVWGALADNHPGHRGQLIIAAESCAALTLCVLAVAMWLLGTVAWELLAYAAVFVVVACTTGSNLILQASVPEIIERADGDAVKQAQARMATQGPVANLLGPLAGAAALTVVSAPILVAADGITSGVCALLMLPAARRISRYWARHGGRGDQRPRNVLRQALGGVRLLLRDDLLRVPILTNAVGALINYGLLFAIPIVVHARGYGDSFIGLGLAATVAGSMLGTLIAGHWRSDRHLSRFLLVEPGVKALAVCVMFIPRSGAALLGGLVLFFLPQGLARVGRLALLTVRFPAGQRGRAMGSYSAVVRLLLPLAPLGSQALLSLGVTAYLWCVVTILGVSSVALVSQRPLRRAVGGESLIVEMA